VLFVCRLYGVRGRPSWPAEPRANRREHALTGSLPGERSTDLRRRCCKELLLALHDLAHSCVGPKKASTYFWRLRWGMNLAIMANLSNFSDMIALEGLPEDLRKGIDINMHTHCYRVTEQGVIMMKMFAINEYRMFDLPKHCKSTARFITDLLSFVDDLINKKKSVDPISVPEKSVVEKPTNNPCKDLPAYDVASQDTIRPFQAEVVNLKPHGENIEIVSSSSTFGGQQNKSKGAGYAATGLTGLKAGLTGSSGVLQNKAKPKMVKPKKPEIDVWKTVEAKGRRKHQKEKPKPILVELSTKSKKTK